MTILQAIILGVVEGFTEFLPVSSTAHLLIAQRTMDMTLTAQMVSFTIAVQLGSIFAAFILYRKHFFATKNWPSIALALVPTLVIGAVVYPHLKFLFTNVMLIIPWTLMVGGALMIWGEWHYKKKIGNREESDLTLRQKCALGLAQTLAFVPGTSRSAAMIVTGLFSGFSRVSVSQFTFILAVPTMTIATLYDFYKNIHIIDSIISLPFVIGFLVAFIVAFFSIRFMLYVVRTYTFTPFGWYRIILGASLAILFFQ